MKILDFAKGLTPPFAVKALSHILKRKMTDRFHSFLDSLKGIEIELRELPGNDREAADFIDGFRKLEASSADFPITKIFSFFRDWQENSGTALGHYFHQDLLVAQLVHANCPRHHVDIGSRIDGLVAHIASFREVEVFDIRPQTSRVKHVTFSQIDIMKRENIQPAYCDSISSLHAIEHFGLGRYGDAVDAEGYKHAIENISIMLETGGTFYLSVPIGSQRIEYNAHRVFELSYLLNLLETQFVVTEISFVDDNGDLFTNIDRNDPRTGQCHYGCVILVLKKSIYKKSGEHCDAFLRQRG